jgi:hypothetical protein
MCPSPVFTLGEKGYYWEALIGVTYHSFSYLTFFILIPFVVLSFGSGCYMYPKKVRAFILLCEEGARMLEVDAVGKKEC